MLSLTNIVFEKQLELFIEEPLVCVIVSAAVLLQKHCIAWHGWKARSISQLNLNNILIQNVL